MFFLPGYILVHPYGGYGGIHCYGSESLLRQCEIGPVASEMCSYVGVVTQCSNGMYHSPYSYNIVHIIHIIYTVT